MCGFGIHMEETHYARAFDWRNYEYTKKPLEFSNTEAGFQTLKAWVEDIAEKHGKTAVIPGMEPTGLYWFALGKFLQDSGMKPVHVNPHHVKKSKELDDNNPNTQYAKIKNVAVSVKNEVMEMIAKVRERKGRLDLPIVSGKHLGKISDRTALQSADNAEKFITTRKIDSFESLAKFTADREQKYQQLETVHLSKGQKLSRLKELSKMYALYAPIQATYKESQFLKGLAKMKYDREHKDSLSKYPGLKERMQSLLQNGEKITPKQWKAEIQSLQSEYDSIGKEQSTVYSKIKK